MAVLGVGVDVLRIERMRRELARDGAGFRDAVFTEREVAALDRGPSPERRFARAFCAKEALAKALGTGFAAGIRPLDLEVEIDPEGACGFRAFGSARERLIAIGAQRIRGAVADDGRLALAWVLIEG